ncbi:unnamed protein product, partial [Owenia fusiformis]
CMDMWLRTLMDESYSVIQMTMFGRRKRQFYIFIFLLFVSVVYLKNGGLENIKEILSIVGRMRIRLKHKVPINNVYFMKTHKTGSSTIQGILFKYGDTHDLTFALPTKGHQFFWPQTFKKEFVMPLLERDGEYNIMCSHMRYHESVHSIMPKNTISVTILRDPQYQFQSAFEYYDFGGKECYNIQTTNPLKTFAENPYKYQPRLCRIATQSPMMYDFGLDLEQMPHQDKITAKIQEIDDHFDIVLIADMMHESLILLQDMLGWDITDLVYFVKAARLDTDKRLTDTLHLYNIRDWNFADVKLYDYFLDQFHYKVHNYGKRRMIKQAHKLEHLLKAWDNECVESVGIGDDLQNEDMHVQFRPDLVYGYNLKPSKSDNQSCIQLATPEVSFTKRLKEKMVKMERIIQIG